MIDAVVLFVRASRSRPQVGTDGPGVEQLDFERAAELRDALHPSPDGGATVRLGWGGDRDVIGYPRRIDACVTLLRIMRASSCRGNAFRDNIE